VPDAAQDSWANPAELGRLATSMAPDEVQLFYQIALVGQRDLPLAPDERSGFEMVVLRMLAFHPAAETVTATPPRRTVPAGTTGTGSERPAAAPADVPVDEAEPAPAATVALDDWEGVLPLLKLNGMAVQLARNVVVGNWDGRRLELRVDPSCRSLLGSLAEQRLIEAIGAVAGDGVKVVLGIGDGGAETPARRAAREQQAQHEVLTQRLRDDPAVRAIQETFDAEIVPGSIRRVD
jgi:DNA polymerase-3 subunit gamma/tau